MGGDYRFSAAIEKAIGDAEARVVVGYPWWLRFWLARDVIAITLGRTIYLAAKATTRNDAYLSRLLRHELVHVRQVRRLGLLRFLWRYTSEFLGHLWRVRNAARAYRLISFEVEAWAEEERADV
jgi:hypothetical protein